ncbi:MAG: class I SAM-dependent methyltransferase [Chloroflexi bacterium]|nr:class I SAM-dependent methyltransferase [Chloroflexota bacterium]
MAIDSDGDTTHQAEGERIRAEYAGRRHDHRLVARYQFSMPGHLLLVQQRERALLDLLRRCGFAERLGAADALDVGCGSGGTLLDLVRYGARPDRLHGVDLVAADVDLARSRLPHADLRCADAAALPFADASFDLVTQVLVLSTILDPVVRERVAAEMLRVVRPDGLIVSYDLRWPSPGNAGVRPIRRADLRRLFPSTTIAARSLTLAPPISRRLARRAWWLAALLSGLPLLHSHLLAGIRPLLAPPPPGPASSHAGEPAR